MLHSLWETQKESFSMLTILTIYENKEDFQMLHPINQKNKSFLSLFATLYMSSYMASIRRHENGYYLANLLW